MVFLATVFIKSAEAWHGQYHVLSGKILEKSLDAAVKEKVEQELASSLDDWNYDSSANSIWQGTNFPDQIKNATRTMDHWHWNDLYGNMTFTDAGAILETSGTPALNVGGTAGFPQKVSSRVAGATTCFPGYQGGDCVIAAYPTGYTVDNLTDTAPVYMNGATMKGVLGDTIVDLRKNLWQFGMRGMPEITQSRASLVKYFLHYMGDMHMPFHNGSVSVNFDLTRSSKDCSHFATQLAPQSTMHSLVRCSNQMDLLNTTGDQGGNYWIWNTENLGDEEGLWFTKDSPQKNAHWLADNGYGTFTLRTGDLLSSSNRDSGIAACNTDPADPSKLVKKEVKFYSVSDENALTLETETWDFEEFLDNYKIYDGNTGFSDIFDCHADANILAFPEATIAAELKTFLAPKLGVSQTALDGLFEPDYTQTSSDAAADFKENVIDAAQDEMNLVRYLIYKNFFGKDTGNTSYYNDAFTRDKGFDAADFDKFDGSSDTFVSDLRYLMRGLVTLSAYRMKNEFHKIYATDILLTPAQIAMGSFDNVMSSKATSNASSCEEVDLSSLKLTKSVDAGIDSSNAYACARFNDLDLTEEYPTQSMVNACYPSLTTTGCVTAKEVEGCESITPATLKSTQTVAQWQNLTANFDAAELTDKVCEVLGLAAGSLCKASTDGQKCEARETIKDGTECALVKTSTLPWINNPSVDHLGQYEAFQQCAAVGCILDRDLDSTSTRSHLGVPVQAGQCSSANLAIVLSILGTTLGSLLF